MKSIHILTAGLLLSACSQTTISDNETAMEEDEAASSMDENQCPVLDSRDWAAWIDAEPSTDGSKPQLIITGEVDLPTPGYSAAWIEGPADRAMPPGQRFDLVLTPPDGMVAQVISTEEVRYQADAAYDAYRVIYVSCGDQQLAEITDIPIAQ